MMRRLYSSPEEREEQSQWDAAMSWKHGKSGAAARKNAAAKNEEEKGQQAKEVPGLAPALAWTRFTLACQCRFAVWACKERIETPPDQRREGPETYRDRNGPTGDLRKEREMDAWTVVDTNEREGRIHQKTRFT
ncbi:hypothetical protein Y1Q_0021597 [Alligator mississippiensis]|uniref:Uncharacterized protein n=1 Tax=Alligator mississippiensis TaxID=8496 RepID=A0A151PA99_ALLMI|nr:hypothetical protein Y1Q_0021597 [Alligator mississippiensis]